VIKVVTILRQSASAILPNEESTSCLLGFRSVISFPKKTISQCIHNLVKINCLYLNSCPTMKWSSLVSDSCCFCFPLASGAVLITMWFFVRRFIIFALELFGSTLKQRIITHRFLEHCLACLIFYILYVSTLLFSTTRATLTYTNITSRYVFDCDCHHRRYFVIFRWF